VNLPQIYVGAGEGAGGGGAPPGLFYQQARD